MPIVFVHGVNNRDGDDYQVNEEGRNGFLREIVGPALGLAPDNLSIENPYWGGEAAKFAWNMAVLPDASESFEKFGGSDAVALGRTVDLIDESKLKGSVVENARQNLSATVDLLYAAALAGATSEEEARNLAASYLKASDYAAAEPKPAWLDQVTDKNFADVLNAKVNANGTQSFGAGGVLDSLKEGLSRLVGALPDAGSALVGRLARKKLNSTLTRFVGDVFVYLKKRGTKEVPGPIVKIVLDALLQANAKKTPADNKLILIAHSFGGEIVYDILTTFAPELQVDCLITVASQIGLFEEMKLYSASRDSIPPNPPIGKVPRPANLKRWLNVFDTNDILSYRVSPVFADSEDYYYDTGYSTLQAHGGYFMRPSFYKRLADRLVI